MITQAIKPSFSRWWNREVGSANPIDSAQPNEKIHAGLLEYGGTVIDPTSGSDWDRLVGSHPSANFFHSSAWARVLTTTYGHQPFYLHLFDGEKSIALLPLMEVASPFTGRRGVSLPFSDFCEPLLFPGSDMESLLRPLQALARARRWAHVEIRGGTDSGPATPSSVRFYGHILDLRPGFAAFSSKFRGSVRRAIKKGESSGLTVHLERSWRAMQEFCSLHDRTRRRHGAPPQPRAFFLQIFEQVIKHDWGFVVLARRNATTVAAAIFFVRGAKALYKFGASDQTGRELRGNNLVMSEAIRFLCANGTEQLHFGRTEAKDKGLRRFKLGWGTEENVISYRRLDLEHGKWFPPDSTASSLAGHFFRRMPLAVNRMAGRLIYPHLD